ncbi:MAG TPA: SidA/IucD/PvdA family monooxygenase [Pseudonocardia sp.]|nr:SidA/IucD/PvdA family monooxygenase [Pseudonocardia sp.]
MRTGHDAVDAVGVGIGPANLSLAALLADEPGLTATFIDRKPDFDWHAGLMLPDARMQVSFLKDLVTPVDPTNPYSFLSFLVERKRLYRLLVTGRDRVPRKEFEQYCRWAAGRLPSLRFGVAASGIEWDGRAFTVHTGSGSLRARNVVCGTGRSPYLPECAAGHDDRRVFHAARLLDAPREFGGARVAVVGGGQSGAEVVHHLLHHADRPASIVWGSSRANLFPLDDSPFVDELFLPNYSRYFHGLAPVRRARLLEQQRMASDGVSVDLLEAIYQRLYDLEALDGVERPCHILMDHRLVAIEEAAGALRVVWTAEGDPRPLSRTVDYVVCATGYRHGLPELLNGIGDRLPLRQGRPVVRSDFSLDWDGPAEHRIYVQNAARHEFGVADPNLSLLAWRSAIIANSLLGRERYDTGPVSAAVDWAPAPEEPDRPLDVALNGHCR